MGTIITLVVPAGLTFAVFYLLWIIQRKKSSLTYEVIGSPNFPTKEGDSKFFKIRLDNSGNQPVEDITLSIIFRISTIINHTIQTTSIPSSEVLKNDSIEFKLPLLNPKESFDTTITVTSNLYISDPEISARATGVTATQNKDQQHDSKMPASTFVITSVMAAAVAITLSIMTVKTQNFQEILTGTSTRLSGIEGKIDKIEELRKRPTREQRIFSILNQHELGHLIPEIITTGEGTPYWKISLFLFYEYLIDKNNGRKYIAAIENIANFSMAPTSTSFNFYLLGKIEQDNGNSDKASSHFIKSRDASQQVYDLLMSQDESFDLNSLRERLRQTNSGQ